MDHDVRIGADHGHAREQPWRRGPGRSRREFRSRRRAARCKARNRASSKATSFGGRPVASAAASNRLKSRAGPMWRTGSSIRSSMRPMVTSPEVAMASNASGETPSFTAGGGSAREGRGALVIRTTAPPRRRKATSASDAGANAPRHYAERPRCRRGLRRSGRRCRRDRRSGEPPGPGRARPSTARLGCGSCRLSSPQRRRRARRSSFLTRFSRVPNYSRERRLRRMRGNEMADQR